jgi:hypothetical protein
MKPIAAFFLVFTFAKWAECQPVMKTIVVENPIPVIRTNETISLSADFVKMAFPNQNVNFIQVKDLKNDLFLITQAVDYNKDGIADEFLFQSNFASDEKKEFAISVRTDTLGYSSKVYASFEPTEMGMQDFTWENDYIGYRFYGLERAQKQGTGTAIDIWCKRIPDLLTNRWYEPDQSYHYDIGYGADHYAAKDNQGCGGSGIFLYDSIYFSQPFSSWKIIANGPIRTVFELEFTGWSFKDTIVETKRVTLDAGHYFNKIEDSYTLAEEFFEFKHAVGFVQREDSETRIEQNLGLMASWESLGENNGTLGTGFIALPDDIASIKTQNNHVYVFMNSTPELRSTYYTGAVWSEFGSITSLSEWERYIRNQSVCIQNPCKILLKK